MSHSRIFMLGTAVLLSFSACQSSQSGSESKVIAEDSLGRASISVDKKLQKYTSVRLTADLNKLSTRQRNMIPLLIKAADVMNELFWYEAYGDPAPLLQTADSEGLQQYLRINYGPWDRLENNEPFVAGIGPKPEGANFYPADMSKEEYEAAKLPDKTSQYTFLRRNDAGELITVPYREQFAVQVQKVAGLLRQAAALAEDPGFKKIPGVAVRSSAHRQLSAQRPGLDGHEEQPDRCSNRAHRDLRRPSLRL